MTTKAVFLDRDGTINVEKGYVYHIQDFELIPGTLEALRLLTAHNISIHVVTNQAGIARGYYSEEDFRTLTDFMLTLFQAEGIKIETVSYCPHHPEGHIEKYKLTCSCRKPKNELIGKEMLKNGYDRENVAVIGDKNSDIEAGQSLGLLTYLVETGYGATEKKTTQASYVLPDLRSCIVHLISKWKLSVTPQNF